MGKRARYLGSVGVALAAAAVAVTMPHSEQEQQARAANYTRYVPDNLFGVSFVSARDGWAAGHYGTLLQTNNGGLSWLRRPLGHPDLLRRVRFLDSRTGWTVSHRGKILFTEDGGSNWVVQHDMPGVYLRDIWMADRDHGWAVGHAKTILRTTDGGHSWSAQTYAHQTQDRPRLNGVAAYDGNHAIVVGEFGTIVETRDGGATWKQLPSPVEATYTAVAVSRDRAIAVGIGGAIVSIPRNGGAPTIMSAPAPLTLLDVALDGNGDGFAAGTGIIYRIAGEGVTPVKANTKGGADLAWWGGIALLPGGRAITVGAQGLMAMFDPARREFVALPDWTKAADTRAVQTEAISGKSS